MWPLIILAVSAALSAASAYSQGQTQKSMYEYNAELARRSAEEERAKAEYQETRFREQAEGLKSKQRLAFLNSGVTPEGTPSLLAEDTAKQLEMDALAIRYGGQSSYAAGIAGATQQQMYGAAAGKAGWWNAGTSLLGAASTAMNSYNTNKYFESQKQVPASNQYKFVG